MIVLSKVCNSDHYINSYILLYLIWALELFRSASIAYLYISNIY